MFSSIKPSRLGVGLLTGGGIGLVIGMLFAGGWPNVPLHAVATDRTDGFAIATGYCDESVEAIYFLDFATGNLSAAVVSKQNGHFNAFYTHNVVADLGLNPAKPPRFMIATGSADLRRSGGKTNALSRSLVYVAELQSGKVAVYAIPWSSSAWNAGQTSGRAIYAVGCRPFPQRRIIGPSQAQRVRSPMQILVNDQPYETAEACTVAALLEQLGLTGKPVAVEVNLQLVPRQQHTEHVLASNDRLEIVTLVGGG